MRAIPSVPLRLARSPELGSVFGHRAKAYWQRYTVWRHRRATARALEGLSDRTLKDIGLDRSEIESVSRDAALHHRGFSPRTRN
ncbi:MAG TPA: DUF1127 domain-containing protein [Hyphomicrobiaceae bacterium]|nr:DUF1127 domain-containing protein [Hyphomicrobiaceae bacterium]